MNILDPIFYRTLFYDFHPVISPGQKRNSLIICHTSIGGLVPVAKAWRSVSLLNWIRGVPLELLHNKLKQPGQLNLRSSIQRFQHI